MLTKWLIPKQIAVYNSKVEYQIYALETELSNYSNNYKYLNTDKKLINKNNQDILWLFNKGPNKDKELKEED